MSNRLADESSPYLLQHQHNPVDWYPWGDAALGRARGEDKPIFLSIGYSACHWCHVMEHESFENPAIAQFLNANFVAIKVDREERPDLDHIYMSAVQVMTGRGGWPMSVFLTPAGEPFFGGTYWPPDDRMGMPGFLRVLQAVHEAWSKRRDQAVAQAAELTGHLRQITTVEPSSLPIDEAVVQQAVGQMAGTFDARFGGFGQAPKFPHAMNLDLLLRMWRRDPRQTELRNMVDVTLDQMARGGIYDHLGGGFARYSVDQRWLVPHFEKMLYDNSLLADVYIEASAATGNSLYRDVAQETLDYLLRDMVDDAGGIHSTEDADSEGEEGKYYVWQLGEVEAVLGDLAATFGQVYDVTHAGNWEGKNILHLPVPWAAAAQRLQTDPHELARSMRAARAKLLEVREQRVRPGRDDKILASWNGLAITALAKAALVWNDDRYRQAAVRAARFVWEQMRDDSGRLLHTWRHGSGKLIAYLDDYAGMANAFTAVYEATFDPQWLRAAIALTEQMRSRFRDPEAGSFYYTAHDAESLIARTKDFHDSSVPSGNGMAATVLIRLGKLCGRNDWLEEAAEVLAQGMPIAQRSALAAGQLLIATDMFLGPFWEVALVGPPEATRQAAAELRACLGPNCVIACRSEPTEPKAADPLKALFQGKTATVPGDVTAYLCQDYRCQEPLSGLEAVRNFAAAVEGSGDPPTT